jgi:hypothetical protein
LLVTVSIILLQNAVTKVDTPNCAILFSARGEIGIEVSSLPKKSRKPTLRIRRHGFRAEITRSTSGIGNIYHYVIVHEDSPEILSWGQERSLKAARACVSEFIARKFARSKTGS